MGSNSSEDVFEQLTAKLTPSFEQLGAPRPGDGLRIAAAVERASAVAASSSVGLSVVAKLGLFVGGGALLTALAVAGSSDPSTRAEPAPPAVTPSSASAPTQAPGAGSEEPVELTPPPAPAEPAPTLLPAASEIEPETKERAAKPKPALSAGELLERANHSRRQGQLEQAVTRYRSLERIYPRSREAMSARVARGRLLLGPLARPKEALSAFESYLETAAKGSLAPEAAAGVARAHRALGHHAREREAWETLIARFPASIYVSEAQARLAEPN